MLARILLIDDSDGEALYVKHMLREAGLDDPIFHIKDPHRALAYLAGDGEYGDREKFPLPDLILLDLRMPEIDGYQVLKWIKSREGLKGTVVVVLTGELNPKLLRLAYQLGATSFLAKGAPVDEFRHFVTFVRGLSGITKPISRVSEQNSRNQSRAA